MKKDELNKHNESSNCDCKCDDDCKCMEENFGEKCECKKGNCKCDEGEKISELVEGLTEENNKLKNDLLRAFADMENLKKRTETDIKNTRDYVTANIVKSFVNVADNLSRAVDAYDKKPDDIKSLIDGIKMINEDFLRNLQSFGVEKIASVGEVFNPELHQAVSMKPCEKDSDDGKIAEEIQVGYSMDGKVIKPSLVVVYKK